MSRYGSLDRADDESHDDYPDRPLPDGVMTDKDVRDRERELDRRAHLDAMQEMADQGRGVYSIPWMGKARLKAKVKHRLWDRRANGWAHCKWCGFAAPVTDDALKIQHQDDHKRQDQERADLADSYNVLAEQHRDLREQFEVQADDLAQVRFRLDVLMVACGHPDTEGLQAVVERIMGHARRVNAQRATSDDE